MNVSLTGAVMPTQIIGKRRMIQAKACFVSVAAALLLAVPALTSATNPGQSWNFSVLLDGDRIGYHRFELTDEGDERRIKSEAKFDVRVLFINAFRYRHSTTEIWSDGCLREINARTQANGKKLAVRGATVEDRLIVESGEARAEFDDCVMTFAYWDPEFLQQPRLLNSQSGEYLDIEVQELGNEPIQVRGEQVDAAVYKVTAEKLELKLWYSLQDEWLALESVAKGGRILRYELT